MTYDYEIGDSAHAIDQELELKYKRGYQVVDAAGGSNLVTDGGTADLTIQAASGDINFGGTTVSCTQDTLDLSGVVDANDPRKVTVYRESNGALNYSAGVAEAAQPSGATRRDAYRPAPPTLSGTDSVVLATVWLAAGTSSITDADIRDRRMPAELDVDTLTSKSVSTDELTTARTWNEVTGSRTFGTTETNNFGTEMPIIVLADSNATDTTINLQLRIDSNEVDVFDDVLADGGIASVDCVVPAGSDYDVRAFGDTADFSMRKWSEFR